MGDIDAGASHYEISFYYESATAKCHFRVLRVDYQHQGLPTHEYDSANCRPHWAPAATPGSHPAPAYDNTSPGTFRPCSRLSQDFILPNSRLQPLQNAMTADQVGVLALLTCVPTVVGLATTEGHPCSIYICCTDPAEGSRLQGSLRKTFPTEDHLSKLRNMPNLRRKHIELAKMKRQRNTFQKKGQDEISENNTKQNGDMQSTQ